MSFEQPVVLWTLIGLFPLAALLFRAYLLGLRDIRALIPAQDRRDVERLLRVKWGISSVATLLLFASIILALADPVWGEEQVESERSQLDISIAFDVSRSMYADDVTPTRLEASRDAVSSLIERFPESRVGFTAFRGAATRVLPVTGDRIALEYVLSTAGPPMITSRGTDVGAGVTEAVAALPTGSNRHGAIVLVSDGEDLSGDALDGAEDAARLGIPVFVIGVGDPEGTTLTLPDGEVVRDADGEVVVSALDEETLERIASRTRGIYVNLSDSDALSRIEEGLLALEGGTGDFSSRPRQRYGLFGWFAVFFAVIIVVTRIVRWRDMF